MTAVNVKALQTQSRIASVSNSNGIALLWVYWDRGEGSWAKWSFMLPEASAVMLMDLPWMNTNLFDSIRKQNLAFSYCYPWLVIWRTSLSTSISICMPLSKTCILWECIPPLRSLNWPFVMLWMQHSGSWSLNYRTWTHAAFASAGFHSVQGNLPSGSRGSGVAKLPLELSNWINQLKKKFP